ncbi:hypothetical protein [Thalassospira lucentensis]|uniref:hypothetical protein n=1 Tax=Thalassospira lucentensis TaxID=168935 RepID=UPI0029439427|nr:hypothetical protein [Thalassospira lucentensis]WOI11709.1 hypothetical protein R1T41_03800 [Thalassospira lucentensis]
MNTQRNHSLLARLKKTTRIWIAVYPTVLVFLTIFGDAIRELPLPLGILVSTVIVVILVSNIIEPLVGMAFSHLGRTFLKADHNCATTRSKNNATPAELSAQSEN